LEDPQAAVFGHLAGERLYAHRLVVVENRHAGDGAGAGIVGRPLHQGHGDGFSAFHQRIVERDDGLVHRRRAGWESDCVADEGVVQPVLRRAINRVADGQRIGRVAVAGEGENAGVGAVFRGFGVRCGDVDGRHIGVNQPELIQFKKVGGVGLCLVHTGGPGCAGHVSEDEREVEGLLRRGMIDPNGDPGYGGEQRPLIRVQGFAAHFLRELVPGGGHFAPAGEIVLECIHITAGQIQGFGAGEHLDADQVAALVAVKLQTEGLVSGPIPGRRQQFGHPHPSRCVLRQGVVGVKVIVPPCAGRRQGGGDRGRCGVGAGPACQVAALKIVQNGRTGRLQRRRRAGCSERCGGGADGGEQDADDGEDIDEAVGEFQEDSFA